MEGEIAHFNMLTFWENMDAVKVFAGEDYDSNEKTAVLKNIQ